MISRFLGGLLSRIASPNAVEIIKSPTLIGRRGFLMGSIGVGAGITLIACGKNIPFGGPRNSAERAFQKQFPETAKIVIDRPFMKQHGLSLDALKDSTNGWGALSKALYGTSDYASYLKRFNGSAESPIAANSSWVNELFCNINDDYCAGVVNIRIPRGWIRASRAKVVQARTEPRKTPRRPGMTRPRPMGTRKTPTRPNGPNGVKPVKPSVSAWPTSSKQGTAGWITISLTNYKFNVEPDVTVARGTGIVISQVKQVGPNKLKVKLNLVDAKTGRHTLKVWDGRKVIGRIRFTVKRGKSEGND